MKRNGFTLVELMITVAVVAILAMIAIPSYTQYVRRSNRTDATKTLTLAAQALERCYSQTFLYTGCFGAPAGPLPSPQGNYTVTVAIPDTVTPGAPAASFLITAVPLSPSQQADALCQSFTLNTTGAQGATPGGPQTCWGST
jgi:type IV pilus assembly protein PilE